MSRHSNGQFHRRGTVTAMTVLSMGTLVGFAALAVDVGMLYNVRTELQRSTDAAALAGVAELATDARIKGGSSWAGALMAARTTGSTYGNSNPVMHVNLAVDSNTSNNVSGDVVIGRLNNPDNLTEALSLPGDTTTFNSVQVKIRKNATRNGPVDLWFAKIFGKKSTNLETTATATLDDRIVGFKIKQGSNVLPLLLPLSIHIDAWNNLLAGGAGTADAYSYNSTTKQVSAGTDGIMELNIYPGAGTTGKSGGSSGAGQFPQLGPGNFGTVDIGSPNNSTADLSRQIRYGPDTSDLAYFGGELKLNDSGYVMLNGDTGLSAGIKDDLTAIMGQPRVIPIFNQVAGNGNNAMYRVVGFAGIRITHVDLTGSMSSKQVIIQPAAVIDPTAQSGTLGVPHFVYTPVRLTR